MDKRAEDTIEQLREAAIRGRGTEEAPGIVCARYGRRGKRARDTIARCLRLMGWARFVDALREAFGEESRVPPPPGRRARTGGGWSRFCARNACIEEGPGGRVMA